MTSRIVQPELLDTLPHDHPEARHNRRDLRLTNVLMGNHRWLAGTLRAHGQPADSILELGAGTGELAMRLQRQGWQVDGLDLCPAPDAWPAGACWQRTDLRRFTGHDDYDTIYGNLIFHQFTADELRVFGARLQSRTRLLLACEPARRRRSQWVYRLLCPLFGANHVTRHDAHVSIAAGFLGDELPRLLGLDAGPWAWRCTTTGRGAYHMVAWRRAGRGIPG